MPLTLVQAGKRIKELQEKNDRINIMFEPSDERRGGRTDVPYHRYHTALVTEAVGSQEEDKVLFSESTQKLLGELEKVREQIKSDKVDKASVRRRQKLKGLESAHKFSGESSKLRQMKVSRPVSAMAVVRKPKAARINYIPSPFPKERKKWLDKMESFNSGEIGKRRKQVETDKRRTLENSVSVDNLASPNDGVKKSSKWELVRRARFLKTMKRQRSFHGGLVSVDVGIKSHKVTPSGRLRHRRRSVFGVTVIQGPQSLPRRKKRAARQNVLGMHKLSSSSPSLHQVLPSEAEKIEFEPIRYSPRSPMGSLQKDGSAALAAMRRSLANESNKAMDGVREVYKSVSAKHSEKAVRKDTAARKKKWRRASIKIAMMRPRSNPAVSVSPPVPAVSVTPPPASGSPGAVGGGSSGHLPRPTTTSSSPGWGAGPKSLRARPPLSQAALAGRRRSFLGNAHDFQEEYTREGSLDPLFHKATYAVSDLLRDHKGEAAAEEEEEEAQQEETFEHTASAVFSVMEDAEESEADLSDSDSDVSGGGEKEGRSPVPLRWESSRGVHSPHSPPPGGARVVALDSRIRDAIREVSAGGGSTIEPVTGELSGGSPAKSDSEAREMGKTGGKNKKEKKKKKDRKDKDKKKKDKQKKKVKTKDRGKKRDKDENMKLDRKKNKDNRKKRKSKKKVKQDKEHEDISLTSELSSPGSLMPNFSFPERGSSMRSASEERLLDILGGTGILENRRGSASSSSTSSSSSSSSSCSSSSSQSGRIAIAGPTKGAFQEETMQQDQTVLFGGTEPVMRRGHLLMQDLDPTIVEGGEDNSEGESFASDSDVNDLIEKVASEPIEDREAITKVASSSVPDAVPVSPPSRKGPDAGELQLPKSSETGNFTQERPSHKRQPVRSPRVTIDGGRPSRARHHRPSSAPLVRTAHQGAMFGLTSPEAKLRRSQGSASRLPGRPARPASAGPAGRGGAAAGDPRQVLRDYLVNKRTEMDTVGVEGNFEFLKTRKLVASPHLFVPDDAYQRKMAREEDLRTNPSLYAVRDPTLEPRRGISLAQDVDTLRDVFSTLRVGTGEERGRYWGVLRSPDQVKTRAQMAHHDPSQPLVGVAMSKKMDFDDRDRGVAVREPRSQESVLASLRNALSVQFEHNRGGALRVEEATKRLNAAPPQPTRRPTSSSQPYRKLRGTRPVPIKKAGGARRRRKSKRKAAPGATSAGGFFSPPHVTIKYNLPGR